MVSETKRPLEHRQAYITRQELYHRQNPGAYRYFRNVRMSRPTGEVSRMDVEENREDRTNPQMREKRGSIDDLGMGTQIIRKIPRTQLGFVEQPFIRLRYADIKLLEGAFGSAAAYQWAVNDIWDPDVTGVGHQPHMRDLWATQYNWYSVAKCDYKITVVNANQHEHTSTALGDTEFSVPALVTAFVVHASTDGDWNGTGVFPQMEVRNRRHDAVIVRDTAPTVFSGTWNPGEGSLDNLNNESDFEYTAIGSSPNVRRSLVVNTQPLQQITQPGIDIAIINAVYVMVELEYTVQFVECPTATRQVSS